MSNSQATPGSLPPSLLQRVAAGDRAAVAETIDTFGGLVWHLARRTLHSRADIEDAVQEVFVELWKAADRFDPTIASERAFVAMIARRRLIDRGRRERSRIASTVNSGESVGDFAAPTRRNADSSVSAPAELSEEAAVAAEAIRQLSPAQQLALRMSFYDGLSHQEIADRLSLPLGTVKTNLRRGLIRVRELLAQRTEGSSTIEESQSAAGGDA